MEFPKQSCRWKSQQEQEKLILTFIHNLISTQGQLTERKKNPFLEPQFLTTFSYSSSQFMSQHNGSLMVKTKLIKAKSAYLLQDCWCLGRASLQEAENLSTFLYLTESSRFIREKRKGLTPQENPHCKHVVHRTFSAPGINHVDATQETVKSKDSGATLPGFES